MEISRIILVFVLNLYNGVSSTGLEIENLYRKNASWDGLIINKGYKARSEGRSRRECGASCGAYAGCKSFFHSVSENACYLYDFVLDSPSCIQSDLGSKYYFLEGGIANTTRSETVCGYTCDSTDDTAYRTVNLADGTPFTYKINRTLATQPQALANCTDQGGELVKVLTEAKMNFLRYIIVNCSDYNSKSFWIDGSNAMATDFYDITQWVTSDGQTLPSSDTFWVSGHPNSPNIDHCVPIWQALGHKWTDRPCSDEFPYICEQTHIETFTQWVSSDGFWIGGSNAMATDFNDITQWVTSDGQTLPSSNTFWVSGHPNNPNTDHCVPIWQALGHKWTDRPCSDEFPYICEQTHVETL